LEEFEGLSFEKLTVGSAGNIKGQRLWPTTS